MKRVWTVLHQKVPRTDAQRRWDQAHQLLLQWTSPSTCTTQQVDAITSAMVQQIFAFYLEPRRRSTRSRRA